MDRNLTRAELETIILFNQEDDYCEIFTFEPTWHKHIEEKFGIEPIEDNGIGGKTYRLPKDRIMKPHPKQKMSEETKKKRRAHLRRLAEEKKNPPHSE